MGEWGESNIQLISAKAEAELGLSLAKIPHYDTPSTPRHIQSAFTFQMSRISRNFVTFQNVTNHAPL